MGYDKADQVRDPRRRRPVHTIVRSRIRRNRRHGHHHPTWRSSSKRIRRTVGPHRSPRTARPHPHLESTPTTPTPRRIHRAPQRAPAPTAASANDHPTTKLPSPRSNLPPRSIAPPPARASSTNTDQQPEPPTGQARRNTPTTQLAQLRPRPNKQSLSAPQAPGPRQIVNDEYSARSRGTEITVEINARSQDGSNRVRCDSWPGIVSTISESKRLGDISELSELLTNSSISFDVCRRRQLVTAWAPFSHEATQPSINAVGAQVVLFRVLPIVGDVRVEEVE